MLLFSVLAVAQRSAFHALDAAHGGNPVTLFWTQSSGPGVTGNNIYRGSQHGGPYTQLYSSSSPITGYVDSSCVGYCFYVVTAVNANGESGYSNEFSAYVP